MYQLLLDNLPYIKAGLAGLVTAVVAYVVTNFGDVFAKVKAYLPTKLPSFPKLTPTPAVVVDDANAELDSILAAVHMARVKSLDKPCEVRTPALEECDSFAATVRNLYAEAAQ